MYKLAKKLSIIIIICVVMFSMVTATAYTVNTQTDKKDTCIVKIQAKSKTANYQITWNANGGKIGSKSTVATTVKKGSKINKLAATPKRSGYTFKGWYTGKSGGNKISKNTKPRKSITYYAQWKKTRAASKLVGEWQWEGYEFASTPLLGLKKHKETMIYNFFPDGKFNFFDFSGGYTPEKFEGKYSTSNGKVYLKNVKWYKISGTVEQNIAKYGADYRKWNWELLRESNNIMTSNYKFGSDSDGNYLEIAYTRLDPDPNFIYPGEKFYKK